MNKKIDISRGSEIYILVWKSCSIICAGRVRRVENWIPCRGTVKSVEEDSSGERIFYAKFMGYDFIRQKVQKGAISMERVPESQGVYRSLEQAKAAKTRIKRQHYTSKNTASPKQLNS